VEDALRNKKKNIIVSWFGGEPLLKLNDILAFSNRIRRLSTEHSANSVGSITTNGVLLSSDTHKALTENGVNVYQITLDGYAHNRQRKYADGTGTFEVVLNNILQMLNSNLDFSLAIRVNISAESFDFSFYELFSAFKNDERVAFLIKPISKWSEDLYLPILEGESARNAVKLHEHHLRSLGFSLFNNCVGIDSGSCYASKKDMLAVRSDGRVQRCTVHLEDELNNIGYVDIENGRIVIDREKEQLWTDSSMNPECYACEELATCFNRSCPWKRITGNTGLCCK
jgi:uncharacterized protein